MKRRRLRKWAKWACTVAAGAAVALAVFSRFYWCACFVMTNSGDTARSIGIGNGLITAHRGDGWLGRPPEARWGWRMVRGDDWKWGYAGEENGSGTTWNWHAGILYERRTTGWRAGVSVLYPVALTLIPATLLWYTDRRRVGPGHCHKCGYDRHGLAPDANCPECGTIPIPAAQ